MSADKLKKKKRCEISPRKCCFRRNSEVGKCRQMFLGRIENKSRGRIIYREVITENKCRFLCMAMPWYE